MNKLTAVHPLLLPILVFACVLIHFWSSHLTFAVNCSPLPTAPPFCLSMPRHDVRRAAKVAFKMSDWLMATFHWLLMKLISLSVPMSSRVNTLHHVTADVNISVGSMALQVWFACIWVTTRWHDTSRNWTAFDPSLIYNNSRREGDRQWLRDWQYHHHSIKFFSHSNLFVCCYVQVQPLSQSSTLQCGLMGDISSRPVSRWTTTGPLWKWVMSHLVFLWYMMQIKNAF